MAQGLLENCLLLPRSDRRCHVSDEPVLICDGILWCHSSWILLLCALPLAADLHSTCLCRWCPGFSKGNFTIPNENKPDSTPYSTSTLGIASTGSFPGRRIIAIWNHFCRVVLCHDINLARLLLLHFRFPLFGFFPYHHYYN